MRLGIRTMMRRSLSRVTGSGIYGEMSSRDMRIVFHHQPKTAGSTFREYLMTLYRPQHVCNAEIDDELYQLDSGVRDGYRLFAGHYKYETIADLFPDCVWLVFLRNPIERVVSNYYNLVDPSRYQPQWVRRAEERPHVKKFLERVQKMSLEEFINDEDWHCRDRVVNRQTRYLMPKLPEDQRFRAYDKEQLRLAKKNLEQQFLFVGVQEEFAKSADVFNRLFGVRKKFDPQEHNRNINRLKQFGEEYSLENNVEKRLKDLNQMDIAIWEYGMELLEKQAIKVGIR